MLLKPKNDNKVSRILSYFPFNWSKIGIFHHISHISSLFITCSYHILKWMIERGCILIVYINCRGKKLMDLTFWKFTEKPNCIFCYQIVLNGITDYSRFSSISEYVLMRPFFFKLWNDESTFINDILLKPKDDNKLDIILPDFSPDWIKNRHFPSCFTYLFFIHHLRPFTFHQFIKLPLD